MNLRLIRTNFSETTTIGELYINDVFFCHTLEDTDRGLNTAMTLEQLNTFKVYGKTAIPYGTYQIVITYSDKFKQYMPLLLNIPAYQGVRIHPGNTAADTDGCLLVGMKHIDGYIVNSRDTYQKLFSKLKAIERKEKIIISIEE